MPFLWLLSLLWLTVPAAGEDPMTASDVDRTRALVEAGALPRNALRQAEHDLALSNLRSELRIYFSTADLSRDEANSMVQAATRLMGLERERLDRARALAEQGALPAQQLEPVKNDFETAQTQFQLARKRAALVRELDAMERAEAARQREREEDESAYFSEGELAGPLEEELLYLDALFFEEFGRPLPISAAGATAFHRSLGFDHTGRFDIAVHPDDPEGRFVAAVLNSWGLPYIAFRSAASDRATGPHIHIGPPSLRTEEEPLD